MAVERTGGTGAAGVGGGVVRPLYGVFIRDQVEMYRDMLSVTLNDLKKGIKAGKPNQQAVSRDGILQGSELTKAKKAALAVDKALKALKPVFGNSFPAPNGNAGSNALGRTGGGAIAMYGVVLADDLTKYRRGISNDINSIKSGIEGGQLTGKAKTEANKAMRSLNAALKALGPVVW